MASSVTAEPKVRASRQPRIAGRLWILFLVTVAMSIAVIGIGIGVEYYLTPFSERSPICMIAFARPARSACDTELSALR
jgi:hypothetical protein